MSKRAKEKNWEGLKVLMLHSGSVILTDEAMSDKSETTLNGDSHRGLMGASNNTMTKR